MKHENFDLAEDECDFCAGTDLVVFVEEVGCQACISCQASRGLETDYNDPSEED